MTSFNLSDWALRHKSFVIYLMLISAIAGLMAYTSLGREEDPPFTIKVMVVKTLWPGATTTETINQITDRIEKKLEEVPHLDYVRSYTKPGKSIVFVNLKDSVRAAEVPDLWYQVRKKVGDIRQNLPSGIYGPYFNDEFGDTYSIIYALTTDGFSRREVRDYAERIRTALLLVPDVAKVDLIGVQDEKIYLEFSTQQIAALGLDINALAQALQAQNAVAPSGVVEAGPERIAIRISGGFTSEESLKAINFTSNGRFFRLSDIAKVRRGYVDPPQPLFRYNGEPAIGLAIAMAAGGDALTLGKNVEARAERINAELPVGIEMSLVANQPHVVKEAVGEFTKTLMEAVAIVLLVSFLALGWRPGVVVAIAIPLVLAVTFVIMKLAGISLQRISLGALIIALGLLVDDAMIAVEMMITKLEEGYDKISAATYTYTSTAFPMLTGTLVTVAGFVPVGFAQSGAGEYCFTLFAVVGIALIVSWVVAVLFTPLTGVFILPDTLKKHGGHGGSRFSRWFHDTLDRALRNKGRVLAGTVALFLLALVGMRFVQQQFFPASDRPELLVNLTLPQNASLNATQEVVARVEKLFKADPDIDYWSFYVGQGAVRFYLPLDAQLANDFFAQAVVVTKGFKQRAGVQARLEQQLTASFDNVLSRVSPLELGPPVGWPVKFRVSGPDRRRHARVRAGVRAGARRERQHAQHQLRLERAQQIHPHRGRPGPRAHARHHLAAARQQHQLGAVRHHHHAAARFDLPDRHRRPRHPRGARQARDAAQPDAGDLGRAQRAAGADRQHLLRPGAAADLASPAPADRHRAGRRRAGRGGDHGRQAAAAGDRQVPRRAALRLFGGSRRHRRGQRQGAAQHLRGVSAHAVPDDDHPDGAADELPAPAAGAADGAAGADRRVRGAADRRAHRWASSPSSASSR